MRILPLFILIPLVELALLLWLSTKVGVLPTLAIVVITGIIGGNLAISQGRGAWRALNERWMQGEMPGREVWDGALILIGGALLLTPGILTDAAGFALMIPAVRGYLYRVARRRLEWHIYR